MRGKFIVIDGIDGCGKGTQAKLLAEYLFDRDKRNHIFLTREPYNSRYYAKIRKLLKEGANPQDNADLMAELFVKDRKVHDKQIKKSMNSGSYVICDRYKYSTLVYQSAQGMPLAKLKEMHKDILVPDLAIILDVPVKVALGRITKDISRSYKEVFEKRKFQSLLRQNFLALPMNLPREKIIILNGNKPAVKVFGAIKKETDKIL